MAWVIGSTKISNPQFRALHWRLLLSYLGVIVAILGISTAAVYEFFAYSLYQKLDRDLVRLADAAAHSLPAIKADPAAIDTQGTRSLDNDGDLDIPWQNLRESDRSVEWFDGDRLLLGKAGKYLPEVALSPNFHAFQQGKIRSLAIPVYPPGLGTSRQNIQGYVRVSASTEEIEEELARLMRGFQWGGLIAVVLSGVGGWWLTKQSLQPIEQSFQQLKQFTADASHELRSPLTAIKTSVEVMQSHPERIHAADVKKLEAIASATNQMTELVQDLLFLARAEAAPASPSVGWIPIPIEEVLEDLVEFLQLSAEEKEITLTSELLDGVLVQGDAAQLRRLFSNLLENALEYTPAGGAVTVSMKRSDLSVIVRVKDTGIGIAPEDLNLVFDRFWRADKARSRRQGGSGLGLAIAQSIAQRHRGDITVTSQLGVGTCFWVRLPTL